MRIRAGLPRGVSAVFYEEARQRRQLEWRLSRALEQQGFGEVILPILDYFAPYETLLAESEKERLYRFVDREGQMLALRGDFTPLLARLLAPRLEPPRNGDEPLRLFYRGDVIRHQESGPNRVRESSQLGAEVIAAPGSLDDQALLEISLEVLLGLIEPELPEAVSDGGRRVEVVLGFAGALDELLEASDHPEDLLAALARRDRETVRRLGGGHSELLLQIVEAGAPEDLVALGGCADGLRELGETAALFRQRYERRGFGVSVDLAEFLSGAQRGPEGLHHDYYCGPVYRLYLPGAAAPLASGGRYDALFESLGADVVAGGFSLGLDQLLEVRINGYQRTTSRGGER